MMPKGLDLYNRLKHTADNIDLGAIAVDLQIRNPQPDSEGSSDLESLRETEDTTTGSIDPDTRQQ